MPTTARPATATASCNGVPGPTDGRFEVVRWQARPRPGNIAAARQASGCSLNELETASRYRARRDTGQWTSPFSLISRLRLAGPFSVVAVNTSAYAESGNILVIDSGLLCGAALVFEQSRQQVCRFLDPVRE